MTAAMVPVASAGPLPTPIQSRTGKPRAIGGRKATGLFESAGLPKEPHTMSTWKQKLALTALTSLPMMVGCAAAEEDDPELNAQREAAVASINGLRTINGLTTSNGLRTINGLSTKNGLRTINGLTTVNGLRTMNGLRTVNGLDVDCTSKTAGDDCTGQPDGLLSASTGMMSDDDGIMTAKYLVR